MSAKDTKRRAVALSRSDANGADGTLSVSGEITAVGITENDVVSRSDAGGDNGIPIMPDVDGFDIAGQGGFVGIDGIAVES